MNNAQIVLSQEEVHLLLVAGQYILFPICLWVARRFAREAMQNIRESIAEIAAQKIKPLEKSFEKHLEDDQQNFMGVNNKLDILLRHDG